ncbi:hypothetical protein Agabi119p4_8897 [Agaricus bisporus var. burnettii]|uniref:Uncharacterized protein n=1 Tax=Agaricus bisporus var. burnettii TaxID=192524 RepID=A0A8H7C697_AGABI|nr:hypothetical protein Agabi119p4_8897 [Agaricus bisporus var. burnettii]
MDLESWERPEGQVLVPLAHNKWALDHEQSLPRLLRTDHQSVHEMSSAKRSSFELCTREEPRELYQKQK